MLTASNAIMAILSLTSLIFCFLTAIILLYYSRGNRAAHYLGLYYLVFVCIFTGSGLIRSQLIRYAPYMYQISDICWLLCMPLSWLYMRTTVTEKPLSPWDGFLLLPILIYLTYDFLPHVPYFPLRALQTIVYWIMQARLLASSHIAAMRKERLWLNWMATFNYLQLTQFVPAVIEMVVWIWTDISLSPVVPLTGVVLSAMTLFFYPRILYSMKAPDTNVAGKTKLLLDDAFILRIGTKLEKFMLQEKPFLNPGYSLKDLAEATDVPLYKLSAYLNQTAGTNFIGYLNQWRIRYCLGLIQEKQIVNLNLNGIAAKCGFSNRNTFSNAFKKMTGKSPSAFLHSNS